MYYDTERSGISLAHLAAGITVLLFPLLAPNLSLAPSQSYLTHPMTAAIAIHGQDIIDLVATYPDGIRLRVLGICFWGEGL